MGTKLQKCLEKQERDDISAWMAHFIAEKMALVESASDEAKVSAQRECFEAILLLWEYRAKLPFDSRPFGNLEPIYRALAHIDPNKTSPSYFTNQNRGSKSPREVESVIEFISSLDAVTRIMISFFVRNAILNVVDESTLEWLGAIKGVSESDEFRFLVTFMPELDDEDSVQDIKQARKKELSEHIRRLETYEGLSKDIKSALEAELAKLEQDH